MNIYTVGFEQVPAKDFFETLRSSPAVRLIDARLNPNPEDGGYARGGDLAYLLGELCGMSYHHVPALAPTKQMVSEVLDRGGPWEAYEKSFLRLMRERCVEETVKRDLLDDAVVMCLERSADQCHRRLVAEYLQRAWPDVIIHHLTPPSDN